MEELDKPGAVLEMQHNITKELDLIFKIIACLCGIVAIVLGLIAAIIPTRIELREEIFSRMNHLYVIVPLASLYLALFIGWPIYRLCREGIARKWLLKNAKITRSETMATAPLRDGTTSKIRVTRIFDNRGRMIARVHRPLDEPVKNSEKTTPVD